MPHWVRALGRRVWAVLRPISIGLGRLDRRWLVTTAYIVTFIIVGLGSRFLDTFAPDHPPGIELLGMHIHHMVFGLVPLLAGGLIAQDDWPGRRLRAIAAILFGIGAAAVLDEFCLMWYVQKDIYDKVSGMIVSGIALGVFLAVLVFNIVRFRAHYARAARAAVHLTPAKIAAFFSDQDHPAEND
jgi:hypothetical protein